MGNWSLIEGAASNLPDSSPEVGQVARSVVDALNEAPAAVFVTSLEGHLLAANATLHFWAGRRASAALGWARALERDASVVESIKTARGNTVVVRELAQIGGLGGQFGPFRLCALPLRIRDAVSAVTFVVDAVGSGDYAPRHSEDDAARVLRAVALADLGMAVHDGGVVRYANEAAVRALGLTDAAALVGSRVPELLSRHSGGPRPEPVRSPASPEISRSSGALPTGHGVQQTRVTTVSRAPAPPASGLLLVSSSESVVDLPVRPPAEVQRAPEGPVSEVADGDAMQGLGAEHLAVGELVSALRSALHAGRGELARRAIRAALDELASSGAPRASAPRDERAAMGGGERGGDSSTKRTAHVLICDDERRLANLMAGLLEQYGYQASIVTTGAAAVEFMKTGDPDIVLLDVNLPGEDTVVVLRGIMEGRPNARVVLSSGFHIDDLPDGLRDAAGVIGYLDKPYTVDRLIQVIEDVSCGTIADD